MAIINQPQLLMIHKHFELARKCWNKKKISCLAHHCYERTQFIQHICVSGAKDIIFHKMPLMSFCFVAYKKITLAYKSHLLFFSFNYSSLSLFHPLQDVLFMTFTTKEMLGWSSHVVTGWCLDITYFQTDWG